MLLLTGAKVNESPFNEFTALMWAAKRDHVEIIDLLLKYEADFKIRC